MFELLTAARAECARSLKRAREQWSAAERARLDKLAEGKSASIKTAAAKALEPELHRLISANRAEARRRADARSEEARQLQVKPFQTAW
jgi:hypothetical protein